MSLAAIIDFLRNNFASLGRYGIVGIFIYGIEYTSYLLLILGCSAIPLYANAAAKIIAGLMGYLLHRVYTFKKSFRDGLYKDFVKYVAVLLINIPLFSLIFYGISLAGLDYKITKILADVICIAIAYLQTRFLVFNTSTK